MTASTPRDYFSITTVLLWNLIQKTIPHIPNYRGGTIYYVDSRHGSPSFCIEQDSAIQSHSS